MLNFIFLLGAFLLVLLMLAWPLGVWLSRIAQSQALPGCGLVRKLEILIYRACGLKPEEAHDGGRDGGQGHESGQVAGMRWQEYAYALLAFNACGALLTYLLQRMQAWLPLNPQAFANVEADLSFNTALSFVSNTNWQAYGGESSLSYLSQMLALATQNFFSAASGIAVAFALIRGFAARQAHSIGNFWQDCTRITLYLLLPLSCVFALFLLYQGVPQNLDPYPSAHLLQEQHYSHPKLDGNGKPLLDAQGKPVQEVISLSRQTLAMGPVASQEAIKMLGTNGGGFFNANSAHPFENPNPLVNFMQMLAIFLIPAALCFCFGRMVGDLRQGWALLAAMSLLFVVLSLGLAYAEQQSHPALAALGIDQTHSAWQAGGNMEGKESRFGMNASALFAAVTTAASCGAVNGMHDSFSALGGMLPLIFMQLGEVVFGGVGSGLYGMLLFAVLTVFICGLMIGRTPEYLGKKIQSFEMKMCALAILVTPALVLLGSALAVMQTNTGIANPGAHGFSEILYAYTSAANNNGSAFAGLSANTPFYNLTLGLAMWFGRFALIVPILAIAGSLAAKQKLTPGPGTLPTHGPLFVFLLVGVVVLVGVLNYVPALALGPVAEHLQASVLK